MQKTAKFETQNAKPGWFNEHKMPIKNNQKHPSCMTFHEILFNVSLLS